MKKLFLESLPKRRSKINKYKVDWMRSAVVNAKVKFVYDDIEGEIEIIDYEVGSQKLEIKYLDEHFEISGTNFIKCKLGKILNKRTGKFKVKIGDKFQGDKRNLIITDREYRLKANGANKKWYKYKCLICGYDEGWVVEEQLLRGDNCSCCRGLTVVPGINSIIDTAPWMVKFIGEEVSKTHTRCSQDKVKVKCPDCGRERNEKLQINNIYNNHSIGCSCSDKQSYPFKFVFGMLEQLQIDFETEYSPEWIKPRRYDFYFEFKGNKYIIEVDGEFHSTDNRMSGQTKEESKFIDNYKDKKAHENGTKVIRIDARISELRYIKNNILNSDLVKIFDLNNINWNKTEEFALSNLIKKVCKLKSNNPNISTLEIGKMMKLNRSTIIEYLKKGSKIWDWINYNPKEEIKKNNTCKRTFSKPLIVLKDGKKIKEFESAAELQRQSKEVFGTRLDSDIVSSICNGKRENKIYKGFTFKYLNSVREVVEDNKSQRHIRGGISTKIKYGKC